MSLLESKLDAANFQKLAAIKNPRIHEFVEKAIRVCNPESVFVSTDSPEDLDFIRRQAVERGEERNLAIKGHTIHYDGYFDQARDPPNTKYLLPPGGKISDRIRTVDKETGLKEIMGFFENSMAGKLMCVRFFSLGPPGSDFAIYCLQITDSLYVAHSEDILYCNAYSSFVDQGEEFEFFRFLHSAGALDERNTSVDVDKRRVFIDLFDNIVYSVNTQYAGNTVGLKKLAFRLAIQKSHNEGWLAEHMFLMAAHGPNGRKTFFTGAFPSACGKTSTAMIPRQTILGDDLAYLKKVDGVVKSVNVENGIFGIIRDVNSSDDPQIWQSINEENEVIFSNILITDSKPYWLGMGVDTPKHGQNHSGEWKEGKTDASGKEITLAHRNARYTVRIRALSNKDPQFEDPNGVKVSGIIYGGRDSNTSVPVAESFDWGHGVISMGASLESETTAATIGQEGVRKFDLMSIIDFLSIPLGKYLDDYLAFPEGLSEVPRIFGVNYFMRDDNGKYMTGMLDKTVWLLWMEGRVHGDFRSIETPIGRIPLYEDLKKLFSDSLDKDYAYADYLKQFTIRVPEYLAKIERIEEIYKSEDSVPQALFDILAEQKARLRAFSAEKGDYVTPDKL